MVARSSACTFSVCLSACLSISLSLSLNGGSKGTGTMDVELKVPSAEYLKRSCAPSQSNLGQTRIQMRVLRARKSKKGSDSRTDTERAACAELGKARKVLTADQTQKSSVRRIRSFRVRSRDARRTERVNESGGVGRTACAGTNRGCAQNAYNNVSPPPPTPHHPHPSIPTPHPTPTPNLTHPPHRAGYSSSWVGLRLFPDLAFDV